MFNDNYASLNAEDRRFVPLPCQIIDGKIGICRFFAKEVSLWSKNKAWLAWSLENLSEKHVLPVNCCFSDLAQQKSVLV